ncbi:MAG TPA: deoxyribonuclease IV [Bacteroidota bacterium]|nr:deoxyribonuclease IV [Bacteroidota bacterium]
MKQSAHVQHRHDDLTGAHESIAGGLSLAFGRAERAGCRALQIFTKNSNQWRAKELSENDIASYKTAASKSNIRDVIAHDSYLINLCASNPFILNKSREAFCDELRRCALLGIRYLNFHPGAHTGAGEEQGIRLLIESLNMIHDQTDGLDVLSVLETTAGQGTVIGHRFEHLRDILGGVAHPERMAVCIDTCHVFTAGYDLRDASAYESTMKEFDDVIGLDRLVAVHMNDSKYPLGSHRDRHEHIGKGYIGMEGFRLIMRDERLRNVPKILETPKGEDLREDRMNLRLLRTLSKRSTPVR